MQKFVLPFLAAILVVSFSSCGKKEEGPDISAEKFITDEITVYSDGYFGLELDKPVEIRDAVYIEKIVEEASKTGEYSYAEGPAEGLNTLWIDFNNGTVISMRADENYGNISETFLMYGQDGAEDLVLPERLPLVVEEAVYDTIADKYYSYK
jgi:hypothetical protein